MSSRPLIVSLDSLWIFVFESDVARFIPKKLTLQSSSYTVQSISAFKTFQSSNSFFEQILFYND